MSPHFSAHVMWVPQNIPPSSETHKPTKTQKLHYTKKQKQKQKNWPIRRSVSEINPGLAIPEDDPAISDTSIGSTAKRVKGYTLRSLDLVEKLNFRILKQILGVFLCGNLGPRWHVHSVRFEVREVRDGTVPQRVCATVQG